MLRVGLTGGIGTGKSAVARLFARLGVPVIDADAIVHELLGAGTETARRVVEAFGPEIAQPNGAIERRKLGEIVFASPAKRKVLNAIVHPAVRAEVSGRLADLEASGKHRLAIVEAALLVETGSYRDYDSLVVVVCDPGRRLERILARDALPAEQARARMASQLPDQDKARVADYVVDNSGTLEETRTQVERIHAALLGTRILADGGNGGHFD